MRVAQGSATVAIITAAGIAPLVKHMPGYRPEMIVLAVCCGGTILSHVNDAGFWLVNEYFGIAVPQDAQELDGDESDPVDFRIRAGA